MLTVAAPTNFRGEWLAPGDPGYEERRAHFNPRFDRRPALIARCSGVQDVRAALRVAREQGWEVTARCGGRGIGGHSTIEGGLLLDLSLMNDVFVDPQRRTARVGPGATQGDVLIETVPYGLAPITGTSAHIGFVGVALFSGLGYLSPRHGFSCDWILSAQIVLASGEVVTASPTANPDLFWAIRGAGDNFGVVVSVETQLHPVPERATYGSWSWPIDQAADILPRFLDLDGRLSEDVFRVAFFIAGGITGGEPVYNLTLVHLGDDEAVARDVAAIDAFGGTPVERSVEAHDWVTLHNAPEQQAMFPSIRQYWAVVDLVQHDDASVELLLDEGRRMVEGADGAWLRAVTHWPYRHAILRQVSSPPAAMNRRHGCELGAIAFYDDPADDARHEAWAEGLVQRFRDAGLLYPGGIVNYMTRADPREVWGDDYDRLAVVKAKYDPDNVFRHNVNIAPA